MSSYTTEKRSIPSQPPLTISSTSGGGGLVSPYPFRDDLFTVPVLCRSCAVIHHSSWGRVHGMSRRHLLTLPLPRLALPFSSPTLLCSLSLGGSDTEKWLRAHHYIHHKSARLPHAARRFSDKGWEKKHECVGVNVFRRQLGIEPFWQNESLETVNFLRLTVMKCIWVGKTVCEALYLHVRTRRCLKWNESCARFYVSLNGTVWEEGIILSSQCRSRGKPGGHGNVGVSW